MQDQKNPEDEDQEQGASTADSVRRKPFIAAPTSL